LVKAVRPPRALLVPPKPGGRAVRGQGVEREPKTERSQPFPKRLLEPEELAVSLEVSDGGAEPPVDVTVEVVVVVPGKKKRSCG
jgi:hypothetical protein